jgi:hypothetical protein
MMEERIDLRGTRPQETDLRQVLLIACQRRQAAKSGVCRTVVDLLVPRPQAGVEIIQMRDVAFVKLAQELVAKRPMPALQFAFALWRVRSAVDQMDPQAHADSLQGVGPISGAIVDDELDRNAPLEERLLEHPFDVQGRLAQAEGAMSDQARGIVDQ